MDPFLFSEQDELHLWDLSVDPTLDLLDAVTQHLSRPPPPPAGRRQSAFSEYAGAIAAPPASQGRGGGGGANVHRRIIEMLRRIRRGKQESKGGGGSSSGGEGSRGFRHMMRERQRRERLSQSYADLYAVLSSRTKADKNSIVQTAAALVRELKGRKEGLQKRNEELMRMTAMNEGTSARLIEQKMELGEEEGAFTVRAENSTSAIDSVIGALRCLERMDVKARAIRAEFAGGIVMTIETNKGSGALEVQEMMERMLAVEGWRSLK